MRAIALSFVGCLVVWSCNGGEDDRGPADGSGVPVPDAATADGALDDATPDAASDDAATADAAPLDTGPPDAPVSIDAPAIRLTTGAATLMGMTSDGYAVYQDDAGLAAVAARAGQSPMRISAHAGSVLVRGKVVFVFNDVDYTTNLATLLVWSAASGAHSVGRVLFADGFTAASDDGAWILATSKVTASQTDVVVAKTDLSAVATLATVGRGSLTTCGPSFGFAGAHAYIAACKEGSTAGTLVRYDLAGAGWTATPIASNVQPTWSADATGTKVFFVTTSSRGRFFDGTTTIDVDTGVGSGVVLPDASAVLYTVGDQLRRSSLADVNPVPIVTTGFSSRVTYSSDYRYVLYSTRIDYVGTEKRDLRIASTSGLNSTADQLLREPTGNVSRSAFTSDSAYVVYLDGVGSPNGATLVVRESSGGALRTFPGVQTAVAAGGSRLLFTDHVSGPNTYPITADLELVDARLDAPPIRIATTIVGAGAFYLTPAVDAVCYARTGTAAFGTADGGADAGVDVTGLWLRPLPALTSR